MKRTIRAFNIKYDTSGTAKPPAVFFFEVDAAFDAEDNLADLISERTGWCVLSCEYEEITEKEVDILALPV